MDVGSDSFDAADPLDGTPYRTTCLLKSGGAASVFGVVHRELGNRFVAKVLHDWHAEDVQAAERMRTEGLVYARLQNHPHLVNVFSFDYTDDHRPYLIMEWLEGWDLREELERQGALEPHQALWYALDALRGLAAAHKEGIVHRDVKPENLFLQRLPTGERRIKVLDYGLAKFLDRWQGAKPRYATQRGVLVGTPEYTAPEQISDAPVDGRADFYALGVVLYELLTGELPFRARGAEAVWDAHLERIPEPPGKRAKQRLPRAVDRVVMKALEKRPDDRFRTAAEFEQALLDCLASLGSDRRFRFHPAAFAVSTAASSVLTYFLFELLARG